MTTAQTPVENELPPATRDHTTVLLVDDQPIIGEAIRRLLVDESKIDFHFCAKPVEAVKLASQIRPTVILQDLVMPDIDGLELVKRFRDCPETAETPIIVLSTKEDAIFKRDAFGCGANDYLVKIPEKLELVARVRYHSKAYLNLLQRNEAYRALRHSQLELVEKNTKLVTVNAELQAALSQVQQLHGLLPICNYCKKIRDDQNYWEQIDHYIARHSSAQFSHGICPDCFEKYSKSDLKELVEEREQKAEKHSEEEGRLGRLRH